MASAYLDTPHIRVKLHSERLIVLAPKTEADPNRVLQEIHLQELERVTLNEHVQITTEAVAELLKHRVALNYVDFRGQLLGQTLPGPGADAASRMRQYQRSQEESFGLAMSRRILAAKIQNQLRLLQRANAYRNQITGEEFDRLRALLTKTESVGDLAGMRGFEGAASALYFELWARYLPAEFPMERRSSHPPHNAVNACLSYGATFIYYELVANLHGCGLDPGLGHLHVTDNTRWSLALDLMEPFRPAVVEALTLRLFTLGILSAGDFEPHDQGVYLNPAGRKKFIAELEKKLERPFLSDQLGHRTTLRQQLREQATGYKAALEKPEEFQPFRLN